MLSVIISTYNMPEWLEKTLWGYAHQSARDFEVVIADDGSGPATRELLDRMGPTLNVPLRHVWHEDKGFRKTAILNQAVIAAKGDYLLFTDGDCIPRRDLVEMHLKRASPGCFLSGGYYKLPLEVSRAIDREAIGSGLAFSVPWLLSAGVKPNHKLVRLMIPESYARICHFLTTTRASFNGCNSSAWKRDIVTVGGFDERMAYGAEDRELGSRLENSGLRPKMIRYSAHVLHLDHQRAYNTPEAFAANKAIWRTTCRERLVWTPYGIRKETSAKSVDADEQALQ